VTFFARPAGLSLLVLLLTIGSLSAAVASDTWQDGFARKEHSSGDTTLRYRLLEPPAPADGGPLPLVLFLHGAGERGDDNAAQLKHGAIEFQRRQKQNPCFVLIPQCPEGKRWVEVDWGGKVGTGTFPAEPSVPLAQSIEVVDALIASGAVDPDRVYVTGLSMGGYGTWYAAGMPGGRFAAAAPMCGGGDPLWAARYRDLPVWAFHGDRDEAVPPGRSREMIDAVRTAGGQPKYTEYQGVGHDCWTQTYVDDAFHAWLFSQRRPAAKPELSFNRDVRPILSDKCYACHGFDGANRQADLRLDTAEGAFAETSSGKPAIKSGDPDGSEAWQRIITDDPDLQMPVPESHKTLSPDEKEIIRRWILAGAVYEPHWAFVPPVRHSLPAGTAGNPIDAFIGDRLNREGFGFSPPADLETLLRRLSLDLTGLPPSPEEIDRFLADDSADAYEQQVERLLASPHYGERMTSFWLDVARYGDTNAYLHDLRRTGWPWRDWVVKAFNDDLPYDQFVVEQLAGDLLPDRTEQQTLATAFLRNHPITTEGGTLAAEYLNEYAADRVQTVGTAFLGLSFNCCRCHDHKFDPLTQADFYSLQAFFNSTTEKHVENNQAPAFPPLIEVRSPLLPDGETAKVMVMEEAPQPTPTFVLTRGQYDHPDHEKPAPRRAPAVFGGRADGPQNRLTLARWLVSHENPLLARVTVNRIWQQFFGAGLVNTIDDFGLQGDYPSHPELLDVLAVDFRDGGDGTRPWSVKDLVRRIVTSAAYRQSSTFRPDLAAKDPGNRWLGRFPRRRLEAEEIRDQALLAAGLLSPKVGGPPVFPYQPAGLWEERSNEGSNTKSFTRSEGEDLYRRSLYTFWKRTCPPPVMTVFDAPDRLSCTVRRSPTNTPLQALATLNDEQFLECAKLLAARTLQERADPAERLTLICQRVTGRTPSADDRQTLERGLADLLARFRSAPADAETLLTIGATPAPPGLDPPELAAWMLIANAALNLDAALVRD
jgi:poly(3-hydroxybutyrate) depolymerase